MKRSLALAAITIALAGCSGLETIPGRTYTPVSAHDPSINAQSNFLMEVFPRGMEDSGIPISTGGGSGAPVTTASDATRIKPSGGESRPRDTALETSPRGSVVEINPDTTVAQVKPRDVAGETGPRVVVRDENPRGSVVERKPRATSREDGPRAVARDERPRDTAREDGPRATVREERPRDVILRDMRRRLGGLSDVTLASLQWRTATEEGYPSAWQTRQAVRLPVNVTRCAEMRGPCVQSYVPDGTERTNHPEMWEQWARNMFRNTDRGFRMGYAPCGSVTPFGWYVPPSYGREIMPDNYVPYRFLYFRFMGSRTFRPTHAAVFGPVGYDQEGRNISLVEVRTQSGELWYMLPMDEAFFGYCQASTSPITFFLFDTTKQRREDRYMFLDTNMWTVQGQTSDGRNVPLHQVDCPDDNFCFGVESRPEGACLTFGSVREGRVASGRSCIEVRDGQQIAHPWIRAPQIGAPRDLTARPTGERGFRSGGRITEGGVNPAAPEGHARR